MRKFLNQLFFGLLCLMLGCYVQRIRDLQTLDVIESRYEDVLIENTELHNVIGPLRWLHYIQRRVGHTAI